MDFRSTQISNLPSHCNLDIKIQNILYCNHSSKSVTRPTIYNPYEASREWDIPVIDDFLSFLFFFFFFRLSSLCMLLALDFLVSADFSLSTSFESAFVDSPFLPLFFLLRFFDSFGFPSSSVGFSFSCNDFESVLSDSSTPVESGSSLDFFFPFLSRLRFFLGSEESAGSALSSAGVSSSAGKASSKSFLSVSRNLRRFLLPT
mmetsp:Transcript_21320/g.43864  ORF Transcript_21320/g.43864 Transcript_21320/m.43864 type:complete len:203 (+) Transcript_21320:72-680(+)